MAVVAVDVETTGFGHCNNPPRRDAVVQVGLAWRNEKNKVQTWSELCNPGADYFKNGRADEALGINRISMGRIKKAKSAKDVSQSFWSRIEAIERNTEQKAELVAFNHRFDSKFLAAQPWKVPAHRWGDCVMIAAANHLYGGYRISLNNALTRLSLAVPKGQAHSAGRDAHAALLIHEKINRS